MRNWCENSKRATFIYVVLLFSPFMHFFFHFSLAACIPYEQLRLLHEATDVAYECWKNGPKEYVTANKNARRSTFVDRVRPLCELLAEIGSNTMKFDII